MGDKRIERMLEEIVQAPGNNYCADCHAPSPRWASVNLGITLCVSCASIHRKLGTHKSRVKSITLDSWTRDQVTSLRSIGNKASNAIYNPDERRHPPPTSSSTDERDSEMEKYIRKKYEQGAFKAGSSTQIMAEPTSRNRFRDAMESGDRGDRGPWDRSQENRRNPELNDLVVRMERKKKDSPQERDLPPLPISASSTGTASAGARERPKPTTPSPAPAVGGLPLPRSLSSSLAPTLIDLGGTTSNSTLPLQTLAPPSSSFLSTSAPNLSPNNQFMSANSYFTPNASTSPMHSPPAMQPSHNPFNQFNQQPQSWGQQPMLSPQSTNPFNGSLSPGNPNAFAHVNSAQGFNQQLGYQQQQFQAGGMNMASNGWQQQQPMQQQQMPMGWMGQGQSQSMPMGMGMGMGNNFAYAHAQGQ